MAGDFTATLSSVFGFFVTAAGCEKDGASRLSVNKKKTHTTTQQEETNGTKKTQVKRLLSYQHHRVHRGSHETKTRVELVKQSKKENTVDRQSTPTSPPTPVLV